VSVPRGRGIGGGAPVGLRRRCIYDGTERGGGETTSSIGPNLKENLKRAIYRLLTDNIYTTNFGKKNLCDETNPIKQII